MIRKFRPIILIAALVTAVLAGVFIIRQNGTVSDVLSSFIQTPLFTGGKAALFNSVAFALFCVVFVVSVISGRSRLNITLKKALKIILAGAIVWSIGFFGYEIIQGLPIQLCFVVVSLIEVCAFIAIYMRNRKRAGDLSASSSIRRSAASSGKTKYAYSVLYGALTAYMVADVVFFALSYPECFNHTLFCVLAAVIVSLILWRIIKWRGVLLFTIVTTFVLLALQMYTIVKSPDACGFLCMTVLLDCAVAVPMCDLYCRKEAAI